MKIVILCGGLGTRLSEETKTIPKPMVKIGSKPIIEHLMLIYMKNGFNDFILAAGYKYKIIQRYFKNHKIFKNVKVINTGNKSLTGLRLFKLKKYLSKEKNFMLTYGDGLTNQNIKKLLKYHLKHNRVATVTAVRPPVRFGEIYIKKSFVKKFSEKPQARKGWINGGFFIFKGKIFNYLDKSNVMLETKPIEKLVKNSQLKAFKHLGFWQCMDTLREKKYLNQLYKSKKNIW